MNLPVANQPASPEKPTASKRFEFATGDRPLSGYTIKRGVGRGGFGEVYFAVSDGGKEVALKLIRRNLDVELRGVQHCLNLKHPNLISLYDVRRDGDDDCWIVMEYVAGESLEAAIARHPQGMPIDEALDWFRGIAAGAAYLHSHGIVHRDLKPGNIFRDESLVKLGDYGLSKFISCSRRSGQTESVGTVHYMAPEVAHGRYGREIDIYALGVILYEMLTGRVPFDGESVGEVLMKHLTAQPDISALPPAYQPVVARALAKDPAIRFSTIEQFVAALPGSTTGPIASRTSDVLPAGLNSTAAPNGQPPRRRVPEPQWIIPPEGPRDESLRELVTSIHPASLAAISGLLALAASPFLAQVLFMWGIVGTLIPARLFVVALPLATVAFVYNFAKNKASTRAAQRKGGQFDPPPTPAAAESGSPVRPAVESISPSPALWAVAGAMLSPLAFLIPLRMLVRSGQPSSLTLLILPIVGAIVGYSMAKRRIKAKATGLPSPRNWSPSSDQPPPLPGEAAATQTDGSAPAVIKVAAPSAMLWAPLGTIIAYAATAAGHEFLAAGLPVPTPLLAYFSALGGVIGYSLAKFRTGFKVIPPASLQNWSASSDTPPPLPVAGGRTQSKPAAERSEFASAAYTLGRAIGSFGDRSTPALVMKSPRERTIELLESLLISAGVAVVLSVIATAWRQEDSSLSEGTWFALSGTLGAWGVLILSKFWEGTKGEPILRRFVMSIVGLGVGACSFAFDRLLLVSLPFEHLIRPATWHVDWSFYDHLNGSPRLAAYLAYFGPMFFLVRWWRVADPLRRQRVNFGALVSTVVVAIGLNLFCPFPQPFGTIVALIISLSVQLASPTVKAGQATLSR